MASQGLLEASNDSRERAKLQNNMRDKRKTEAPRRHKKKGKKKGPWHLPVRYFGPTGGARPMDDVPGWGQCPRSPIASHPCLRYQYKRSVVPSKVMRLNLLQMAGGGANDKRSCVFASHSCYAANWPSQFGGWRSHSRPQRRIACNVVPAKEQMNFTTEELLEYMRENRYVHETPSGHDAPRLQSAVEVSDEQAAKIEAEDKRKRREAAEKKKAEEVKRSQPQRRSLRRQERKRRNISRRMRQRKMRRRQGRNQRRTRRIKRIQSLR